MSCANNPAILPQCAGTARALGGSAAYHWLEWFGGSFTGLGEASGVGNCETRLPRHPGGRSLAEWGRKAKKDPWHLGTAGRLVKT